LRLGVTIRPVTRNAVKLRSDHRFLHPSAAERPRKGLRETKLRYIALTMFSVTFLASPSSIMVLSR
jgi:hypothetical protein